MKVGRFIVNFLIYTSYRATLKRRKNYPSYSRFRNTINIKYKNDENPYHQFDVFLADEHNRKKCCIIDIHGGAYVFGEHYDNYPFGVPFLEKGYDFVTVDYEPNNGKKDTKDLVDDIYACIKYLLDHKEELGIDYNRFVITGDSAGGHLALLFTELILNKTFAKQLGYEFPNMKVVACLVNCPVYNFAHIGDNNLSKSGMKRMFGPHYNDIIAMELLCPKIHLSSLKCPVFTSTCSQDFLRSQSFELQEDLKDSKYPFKLVDIASNKKGIGHVHNVLHPEYEESIIVNDAMMKFIESNLELEIK